MRQTKKSGHDRPRQPIFLQEPPMANMADNQVNDRYQAFFGTDFMPLIRHDQTQGAPERSAYADEYAAFHLGQINQKLGRLIELMERTAENGKKT
jgi:hypothetical protein